MRNAFADQLYEEAKADPRIYIITADISPVGSIHKFREEFPDRFINVGVSEQSMIAIAAGLALKGKRPFCYTIANFALYRPFEFIRNDICYQNLPVVVVGMGAGMSYADHGATHHTMEDIAIAGALPNMTVLSPCDPFETRECVKWCAEANSGPVYLRLSKAGEPTLVDVVNSPKSPFALRTLHSSPTTDHRFILTHGSIAKLAVDVGREVGISVISMACIKPLSSAFRNGVILSSLPQELIIIEEHVMHGGLASRINNYHMLKKGRGHPAISWFGLRDEFVHYNGTREDMLAQHGLTVEAIVKALQSR